MRRMVAVKLWEMKAPSVADSAAAPRRGGGDQHPGPNRAPVETDAPWGRVMWALGSPMNRTARAWDRRSFRS
jgi:hypothetical protein